MAYSPHFYAYVVVLIILLVEISYFFIATLYFLFQNPQYRVFWAAFCLPPTEEDINQPYSAVAVASPGVESKSHATVAVDESTAHGFRPQPQHLVSKQSAFIHYGLETISHCFLLPAYLAFIIIFMGCRLNIELIKHTGDWREQEVFCDFAYKSYLVVGLAHNCVLVILCIPALKAEYMYQSTKYHRQFIIFTIIWIILDCFNKIIKSVAVVHDVVPIGEKHYCIPVAGIGTNIDWTYYVVGQFYFSIVLTFLCVIIPICAQRARLTAFQDAPNENKENEELLTLLKKINKMSKRLCVGAAVLFISLLTVNMLFWEYAAHPTVQPYLSMANTIIYVNLYWVIICVYQNWKTRLCPWNCGQKKISSAPKGLEGGEEDEERAAVTKTELVS